MRTTLGTHSVRRPIRIAASLALACNLFLPMILPAVLPACAPNFTFATAAEAAQTPSDAAKTPDATTSSSPSLEAGAVDQSKEAQQARKDVETLLGKIESDWNAHNLTGVMSYYADDYMNNDGMDKKAVSQLTDEFWKTYPDVKSASQVKEIRIEGSYATVVSEDTASGTTAKEIPDLNSKGELKSYSEGQLYLKKVGLNWKIIGDRIEYEKVSLLYGMAKQVQGVFSAPEQVKSGRQYAARLDLDLPPGMQALASITSQPLQYPLSKPTDVWRGMESTHLERLVTANAKSRNELLTASVGILRSAKELVGIGFYTRRVNMIANMEEAPQAIQTANGSGKGDNHAVSPATPATH